MIYQLCQLHVTNQCKSILRNLRNNTQKCTPQHTCGAKVIAHGWQTVRRPKKRLIRARQLRRLSRLVAHFPGTPTTSRDNFYDSYFPIYLREKKHNILAALAAKQIKKLEPRAVKSRESGANFDLNLSLWWVGKNGGGKNLQHQQQPAKNLYGHFI